MIPSRTQGSRPAGPGFTEVHLIGITGRKIYKKRVFPEIKWYTSGEKGVMTMKAGTWLHPCHMPMVMPHPVHWIHEHPMALVRAGLTLLLIAGMTLLIVRLGGTAGSGGSMPMSPQFPEFPYYPF